MCFQHILRGFSQRERVQLLTHHTVDFRLSLTFIVIQNIRFSPPLFYSSLYRINVCWKLALKSTFKLNISYVFLHNKAIEIKLMHLKLFKKIMFNLELFQNFYYIHIFIHETMTAASYNFSNFDVYYCITLNGTLGHPTYQRSSNY